MKPDPAALATLSAVIGHDLGQVRKIHLQLQGLRPALERSQPEFRDLAAVAYLLHNLYNALENSFDQTSRTFENHVVDTARWHRELLEKMFLEIPGLRPALLPEALRPIMNDLRGFRHLFRHSYDFELDVRRLLDLCQRWFESAEAVVDALDLFRQKLLLDS